MAQLDVDTTSKQQSESLIIYLASSRLHRSVPDPHFKVTINRYLTNNNLYSLVTKSSARDLSSITV